MTGQGGKETGAERMVTLARSELHGLSDACCESSVRQLATSAQPAPTHATGKTHAAKREWLVQATSS
eukprot:CAMPEP_0195639222 /NCGR_PEP_ID=MMETSP0815-20121206/25466_1 /TAXON_ID=97485 /ORGANISM="Prymnesium parvum, Strain Texoma1" /LENGTH=66 /DNA_ID=CAMNT_0040781741 /DNA_START=635 /DNA_END=833 /DNA_ORIENTATION=-